MRASGNSTKDRGRALGTAHSRQPQVHHHQAGTVFTVGLESGVAVARFGDDLHVGFHVQRRREPHANHEVIVNDQNTNWF